MWESVTTLWSKPTAKTSLIDAVPSESEVAAKNVKEQAEYLRKAINILYNSFYSEVKSSGIDKGKTKTFDVFTTSIVIPHGNPFRHGLKSLLENDGWQNVVVTYNTLCVYSILVTVRRPL